MRPVVMFAPEYATDDPMQRFNDLCELWRLFTSSGLHAEAKMVHQAMVDVGTMSLLRGRAAIEPDMPLAQAIDEIALSPLGVDTSAKGGGRE